MAGENIVEKRVFFLGSWKAHRLSEKLLHEISELAHKVQGVPSILQFTREGIKTMVLEDDGGTNKVGIIPEKNVKEIRRTQIPACLICTVKEGTHSLLNILVWRCMTESHLTEILTRVRRSWTFNEEDFVQSNMETTVRSETLKYHPTGEVSVHVGDYRRSHVMENGYDFDMIDYRRQYSSPPKSPSSRIELRSVSTQSNGESPRLYEPPPETTTTAVQTDPLPEPPETITVAENEQLKTEILHLSNEVKELKMMVETSEISKTEYVKRTNDNKRKHSENDDVVYVPPTKMHTREIIRAVPEYSLRNHGIQTEKKHHNRKIYEVHRKTRKPEHFYLVKKRTRSSGDTYPKVWRRSLPSHSSKSHHRDFRLSDSSAEENVFLNEDDRYVRQNSNTSKTKERIMGYVTLPPENKPSPPVRESLSHSQRHFTVDRIVYSGEIDNKKEHRSSTIVRKPIEDVYVQGRRKQNGHHVVKSVHRSTRLPVTPYTFDADIDIENGLLNGNGHIPTPDHHDIKPPIERAYNEFENIVHY